MRGVRTGGAAAISALLVWQTVWAAGEEDTDFVVKFGQAEGRVLNSPQLLKPEDKASLLSFFGEVSGSKAPADIRARAFVALQRLYLTLNEYRRAADGCAQVEALTKEPQVLEQAYATKAQAHVQLKEVPAAVEAYRRMLDWTKDPSRVIDTYSTMAALLRSDGDTASALLTLQDGASRQAVYPADVRLALLLKLATELEADGRAEEAAKLLDGALAQFQEASGQNRAALAKQTAGLYVRLKNAPKGASVLAGEIQRIGDTPASLRLDLRRTLAELCREHLKDEAREDSEHRAVMAEASKAAADRTAQQMAAASCGRLAEMQSRRGKLQEGCALLLGFLREQTDTMALDAAVQKLIDLEAGADVLDEACWILRSRVVAPTTPEVTAIACQAGIVNVLLAAGRHQEALQEARCFFHTCSPREVQQAIDLVVRACKAADMNLARANRFLKFQKFGPAGEDGKEGTADDVADVLEAVPRPSLERRTRLFQEALKSLPRDWQGHRARSRMHLFLGDPVAALEDLRASFIACPASQAELQSATDALTSLVVRLTRESGPAENLVKYLMYGRAGEDGREGTADDIEDPTAVIRQKLARKGGSAS
jgi:tetratricopeptide (TPR) repeat protein